MQNASALDEQLTTSLALTQAPIAVSFHQSAPEGIAAYDATASAGCQFWEQAAQRTFMTSAVDHSNCSIGMHTHNLANPNVRQPKELETALQAMIGLDYVREAEVAAIPTLSNPIQYVVYGPLRDATLHADLVLVFAQAQQGLIITEAIARVDGGSPIAMGRPACAVLPQVMAGNKAAMSLGCCGARAYLDGWNEGIALWAFPAAKMQDYVIEINALANANKILTQFHTLRREDVEAGKQPTVEDSLERLAP